ncbi:MAG TPA: hypothetical protein HPP76_04795 [Desulfuromonadales bacterium]|nr:hypothetical protein [Desulfuromonadales bacterium]
MTPGDTFLTITRISWPFLGGAWGAVVGFGGYLNVSHNADSFGSFFALGFFVFFAVVGLLAGAVCGMLAGGITEKLLCYFGIGVAGAVSAATVVNVLVIWQLAGFVQNRYPGLRAPAVKPHVAKPAASPPVRIPAANPCAQPPPENPKERANWNAECR